MALLPKLKPWGVNVRSTCQQHSGLALQAFPPTSQARAILNCSWMFQTSSPLSWYSLFFFTTLFKRETKFSRNSWRVGSQKSVRRWKRANLLFVPTCLKSRAKSRRIHSRRRNPVLSLDLWCEWRQTCCPSTREGWKASVQSTLGSEMLLSGH